jgi:hypothetical protein
VDTGGLIPCRSISNQPPSGGAGENRRVLLQGGMVEALPGKVDFLPWFHALIYLIDTRLECGIGAIGSAAPECPAFAGQVGADVLRYGGDVLWRLSGSTNVSHCIAPG